MHEINYIFWMLAMVFVICPFYLVGAFILIEDESTRKKFLIWGSLLGGIFFSFLLFKQMNVEFIYGKDLLDYWYSKSENIK